MAADGDWQDFYEFQEPARSLQDEENCNASPEAGAGPGGGGDGFPALACSLEEKLSLCFRPSGPGAEPPRAAVRPITECSLLQGDEIWNALTDNYGNVMPVDWKSSHTRTLHLLTLNLSEKGVIEEIEEMMQESPDPEDDETPTQSDRLSMLSQEIQTLQRSSTSSYEERVKRLSVSELNELLEEIETAIKEFSEELVQQLALRDELEFEKEVKNSFISVLIEVQNKQKEHKETAKKKKKLKNGSSQNGKNERSHMPGTRFSMEGISNVIQNGLRHTFGNSGGEKQYLTTVIPYEKKNGPPSVEDLQILTKILRAMKEDSEKVPSLLTDYILKVLCPT
ncbi:fasciculation and elongation protein zeta-2 isoform X4 [Mirounga angustirostris]|uniref:fasciculation and elongation protein zeta-2 isoform X3 n=1 Tax=Mirounga leonina TaxID=9715 RepID=UPI00156C044A|nr:fasciculation and elongation protein zeta-2 isoform X3 [Mirounga leonina]XP_045740362.1 fasciculation and elongation protein zeta-2 isoform X3 [Mirounga angustirostris]